jgi:ubiquinone/menaquinone biosynthesis C-methylase UbiE
MRLSTVRLLTCCASLQNLTISRSTRKYLECMARVLTAEGNSMIKDSRRRIECGSFLVAAVNEERIGGGIEDSLVGIEPLRWEDRIGWDPLFLV